jgi:hypothetical protein
VNVGGFANETPELEIVIRFTPFVTKLIVSVADEYIPVEVRPVNEYEGDPAVPTLPVMGKAGTIAVVLIRNLSVEAVETAHTSVVGENIPDPAPFPTATADAEPAGTRNGIVVVIAVWDIFILFIAFVAKSIFSAAEL